ncbi:MAG: PA2169 family four-helix-bundle protein [Chloroflexi bacterium]|nr:PA2169 family four-helix-bundle protein [Chloroflexota bacterium]
MSIKTLGILYRMLEAGEKGYAVAAANVNNQAVKILFMSYAQQRARFKANILAEAQRLNVHFKPRSSFRGMLHRGRIDIFAALTIGADSVERVVLKEVLVGEKAVKRTYEKVLRKELPPETREIIEYQFEEISKVVDQVTLMRGKNGKQLIVRMFDSEKDAGKAVQLLKKSDIPAEAIENVAIQKNVELYEGRGTTKLETFLSGMTGGALWGALIGALAGIGAAETSAPSLEVSGAILFQPIWVIIALAGVIGGSFVGGGIGLFIGWGILDQDAYVYEQSIKPGRIIVKFLVNDGWGAPLRHTLTQAAIDVIAQASEAPAQA